MTQRGDNRIVVIFDPSYPESAKRKQVLDGHAGAITARRQRLIGAFGQALDIKRQLGEFGAESTGYIEALHAIVRLCQDVLAENECHGDAQVVLADAFYLLHLKIHPTNRK